MKLHEKCICAYIPLNNVGYASPISSDKTDFDYAKTTSNFLWKEKG